jgi:hypothetical protein
VDEPFELFAYTTTKSGDRLTIAVSGEIDMTNAGAFAEVLIGERAACVIVDLTGVTFMDSSVYRHSSRRNGISHTATANSLSTGHAVPSDAS